MWVLGENLAESFKFLSRQTFRQTFETRDEEWLKYGEKLIIADILPVELGLSLLDIKENIIQNIQDEVLLLR